MGTKARRKFTAQFKLEAVLEVLAGYQSVALISASGRSRRSCFTTGNAFLSNGVAAALSGLLQ